MEQHVGLPQDPAVWSHIRSLKQERSCNNRNTTLSVFYCEVNNVIHSLSGGLKRTRDTEAPPAHTDPAPAPVNQNPQKRTETCSCYTHGLETWKTQMLVFQLFTSFVFLSIFCRRMRKLWGSLFTSSSKHHRFMHSPASQKDKNTQPRTHTHTQCLILLFRFHSDVVNLMLPKCTRSL